MLYCPKCDMEFVEGVTICTDCGGPLVNSKEEALALAQKEKEELQRQQEEEFTARMREAEAELAAIKEMAQENGENTETACRREPAQVYVKKSQRFDDLQSSASAFLLIGSIMTLGGVLLWLGIIPLPMAGVSGIITKSVLTLMGIGALIVAFTSSKDAKKLSGQIAQEEETTKNIIQWFLDTYTGEQLDKQILSESGQLSPEEHSLKRFDLIQDLLITNKDLADPSYVDLLCEEIYSKLFEN